MAKSEFKSRKRQLARRRLCPTTSLPDDGFARRRLARRLAYLVRKTSQHENASGQLKSPISHLRDEKYHSIYLAVDDRIFPNIWPQSERLCSSSSWRPLMRSFFSSCCGRFRLMMTSFEESWENWKSDIENNLKLSDSLKSLHGEWPSGNHKIPPIFQFFSKTFEQSGDLQFDFLPKVLAFKFCLKNIYLPCLGKTTQDLTQKLKIFSQV